MGKYGETVRMRAEIGDKQVNLTYFGAFCDLKKGDCDRISNAIQKGRRKGLFKVEKTDDRKIWVAWSIAFDKVKTGDTVQFCTAGKYNLGFHTTETYVGCVQWVKGDECAVKSNGRIAVIKIKHIERVI